MNAAAASVAGQAQRGERAEGAGLVSYKTTVLERVRPEFLGDGFVSFSKCAAAERRIKRLKRSVWSSGHLHGLADRGFRASVCWFVTLTYVGVNDWAAEHIKDAVNRFRKFCARAGVPCRYTWVAELQERGAVHYHLLAWLPHGIDMPRWDRDYTAAGAWQRFGVSSAGWVAFWPHGMTNTQPAKSGVGYLMKYLSKLGMFHRFPKGLRLYGIGGLDGCGKSVRRWFNLPEWAKLSYGVGELVRKKVGLVVSATGEILEAGYSVRHVPGGIVVRALREFPERWFTGAYSTLRVV
jgi:hypothetical protein